MFSRLVRQLVLFILSVSSSIVVGWLLMDQMERNRRETEARDQEIPLPLGSTSHRNGTRERTTSGVSTATKPPSELAEPKAAAPKVANTPPKSKKADDLTIVEGIGPAYAKALNAIGITTFAELAKQDPDDLAQRLKTRITAERIRQDDWVGQAKQLSS